MDRKVLIIALVVAGFFICISGGVAIWYFFFREEDKKKGPGPAPKPSDSSGSTTPPVPPAPTGPRVPTGPTAPTGPKRPSPVGYTPTGPAQINKSLGTCSVTSSTPTSIVISSFTGSSGMKDSDIIRIGAIGESRSITLGDRTWGVIKNGTTFTVPDPYLSPAVAYNLQFNPIDTSISPFINLRFTAGGTRNIGTFSVVSATTGSVTISSITGSVGIAESYERIEIVIDGVVRTSGMFSLYKTGPTSIPVTLSVGSHTIQIRTGSSMNRPVISTPSQNFSVTSSSNPSSSGCSLSLTGTRAALVPYEWVTGSEPDAYLRIVDMPRGLSGIVTWTITGQNNFSATGSFDMNSVQAPTPPSISAFVDIKNPTFDIRQRYTLVITVCAGRSYTYSNVRDYLFGGFTVQTPA